MSRTYSLGRFQCDAPDDWCDVTSSPGQGPLTLARRPGGVGQLQLTVSAHVGPQAGFFDEVDATKIMEGVMGKVRPDRVVKMNGALRGVFGDYRRDGGFFRTWVVSDGRSVALVTYGCPKADAMGSELTGADAIVASLQPSRGLLARLFGRK